MIRSLEARRRAQYWILLAPGFAVFCLGLMTPFILGFRLSLTDWNGLSPDFNYVGLKNYLLLFRDKTFLNALSFTTKYTFLNALLQNVLAFGFALILDRSKLRGRNVYRALFFIPALLSPIMVGFLWRRIFLGLLPMVNDALGLSLAVDLFGRPETVILGHAIVNTWQWFGYWIVVYLAALQTIPRELYESARIDGASELRVIRHITIPMIAYAFTVCVVAITTSSFKIYDQIVFSTQGGPGRASESVVLYIYDQAFELQRPAYASTVSVVFFLFLMMVAGLQIWFFKRREVQV